MAKFCTVATNFLMFCSTGSANGVAFVVGVSGFECDECDEFYLMSAKLIYVLSSFPMIFCAFYIHIHIKLITFHLNLVL